jgi:Bax protein
MLNLNSHYAYEKMRLYRSSVLKTGTLSGYKMANYLDKYAEIGLDYTLKVKDMIRSNKFGKFDNSYLDNNNDHHLIIN